MENVSCNNVANNYEANLIMWQLQNKTAGQIEVFMMMLKQEKAAG